MSLHERVAAVLGCSVKETQGFSLQMLREMVRGRDDKLAYLIGEAIRTGEYLVRDEDGRST